MTISYFGDGIQQLKVIPHGDGWDVYCPECGAMDHQPYRVPGPDGAQTDFVASGGTIRSWTCPNCSYAVANQLLQSTM